MRPSETYWILMIQGALADRSSGDGKVRMDMTLDELFESSIQLI